MKTATVKKQKAKPKIKPLERFSGYVINRDGPRVKPGRVSFGCGSVSVTIKTLLETAKAFEDKGYLRALAAAKKLAKESRSRTVPYILTIDAETLRRIAGTNIKK